MLQLASIKKLIGTLILDLPRYVSVLWARQASLSSLANRNERLDPAPDRSGYRCDWQWTSDLHAPKVLPALGRWLMRRALSEHPIRRLSQPEFDSEHPEVSFIIGHRGTARLPHLLATLKSIAGQKGASFECLVVEQETQSRLSGQIPTWVRHIHTPPPAADMPYCRAWTFNIGAREARGRVLILHDNDMLVPEDYISQIFARVNDGYEVVNLKRFIFYLSEAHTNAVFARPDLLKEEAPETIVQNLEAGGSVAITRDAYYRIGGMDESFIGWGGEDNEFWERAQTCEVWPYSCLPIVHLWHPNQPGKIKVDTFGKKLFYQLSDVPVNLRINALRNREQGMSSGPNKGQEHRNPHA